MMKSEERWIEKDSLRLLRFHRSRYATPGQDQTGQQRHLHAVGLAVAHAEAAEPVLPPTGPGQRSPKLTGGLLQEGGIGKGGEGGLGGIDICM